MLPGSLQFDLAFAPASDFRARGPKFRLLFGHAGESILPAPPLVDELFGYAVHHALRARFCVERGRVWQAEYWISGVRDYGLTLACRRRGLPTSYGRGFDQLPDEVKKRFADAIVRSLDREELLRSLSSAIDVLLQEADEVRDLAERVRVQINQLIVESNAEDAVRRSGLGHSAR